MKLAVSMWSYFSVWREGKLDVPGFIREAKSAGAEGVELLDFFYNEPGAPRTELFLDAALEAKRDAAKEVLEETGLPVAIFSVANNFAKPTPDDRRHELAKIEFGVREAARFGADTVRVFAGDLSGGIDYESALESIVEGLSKASVYAHDMGVKLALENHGRLAGRSEQVLNIVGRVREASGLAVLGANPDTGNFLLVGQQSEEAVAEVAHIAHMAHLKDFRRGAGPFESLSGETFAGVALGEGDAGVAECVQALRAANFVGWTSLEYEGSEDPFAAVPRSLAAARAMIG